MRCVWIGSPFNPDKNRWDYLVAHLARNRCRTASNGIPLPAARERVAASEADTLWNDRSEYRNPKNEQDSNRQAHAFCDCRLGSGLRLQL